MQRFSFGIKHWGGFLGDDFALDENEMFHLTVTLKMFSYINSIVNVVIYYLTSK